MIPAERMMSDALRDLPNCFWVVTQPDETCWEARIDHDDEDSYDTIYEALGGTISEAIRRVYLQVLRNR